VTGLSFSKYFVSRNKTQILDKYWNKSRKLLIVARLVHSTNVSFLSKDPNDYKTVDIIVHFMAYFKDNHEQHRGEIKKLHYSSSGISHRASLDNE